MAKMRSKPMKRRARNKEEDRMVSTIDDLRQFEEFRQDLLPALKKAIKDKKSSKDILEIARSLVTVRLVTIAALDPSATTALAATKDILDRLDGKATERKELLHSMSKLKDEELDALVITAIKEGEE